MSKNGTGQPELNQETAVPETSAVERETTPASPAAGSTPPEGSNRAGKENVGPERKIGLVTFLQVSGANKYVEAILQSKYAMEAHTRAEWEQIVKGLLNRKVK
jgi:hypothetical protein